jgi:hypothetical protein
MTAIRWLSSVGLIASILDLGNFAVVRLSTAQATPNAGAKLVLLYDNSNSQNYLLYGTPEVARRLALTPLRNEVSRAIADNAGPATVVRIASFGTRVLISPAWVKTAGDILAAFGNVTQEGGPSPIWDGVYASVQALEGASERKQILLISDGKASANLHGFEETRDFAKLAAVTITAVYVLSNKRIEPGEPDPTDRLKSLADATGGRYAEKSPKELPAYCGTVVKALRVPVGQ